MLTARTFADRYSGQTVKIANDWLSKFDTKDGPIGIIVGFRAGQKGVIGSSKVAVWRDKYEVRYELMPTTGSLKFNSVVPKPPSASQGIYFLSVNQLAIVANAATTKKAISYPSHCVRCNAPSRSGTLFTVCSNTNCKINKKTIKALGPFKIKKAKNLQPNHICPSCGSNNFKHILDMYASPGILCSCGHKFTINLVDDDVLKFNGILYTWQTGGKLTLVDKDVGKERIKNG